ncbi:VOC family protein [Rossellomorea aquimaris]|uniref:VOC family protein n=1 Tax=Rossellomorea aquimaris TaxID=189382 RepID=UPI001CD81529|nr:VOC family protein [Rossellomorea aquimaris]MCA1053750.1 VOC family protein [Rossellomorea aquimaris]
MMVQVFPYLVMDGNAKEAINFYQEVLGAEVLYVQTFGESPGDPEYPLPEETKDRIMHATLKIGESELMFSDTFPGQPHATGNQVTLCITTSDPEKSKKLFEGLKQEGEVTMPLQKTIFSPLYGCVIDKFGVNFQIYTGEES